MGLIEGCRRLGGRWHLYHPRHAIIAEAQRIANIAYSPIAVGCLTRRYSQQKLPRGARSFGHIDWAKLDPIVQELKRVGENHGKTPTAVALNQVMCKGAISIPTLKHKEQVDDCLQALGWKLSRNEEDRLDALGLTNAWDWNLIEHFQNWWWQQGWTRDIGH